MAGNNNENDINEITNFDESVVMSSLEAYSTPNAGQNKIVELKVTDQSNVIEDSGVQLTPTSTKCNNQFNNDVMNMLITISKDMNEQKNKFDKLSSDVSEVKSSFDVQNSKFDVINSRFDVQNSNFNDKFNEIRDEIKQQNINFSKQVDEINIHFDNMKDEIIELIDHVFDKQINLSLIHI